MTSACLIGLLANVTELLPRTPAADAVPPQRVPDGRSAVAVQPLL